MTTRQDRLNVYRTNGVNTENLPPVCFKYGDKSYKTDLIDAYDLNKDIQLPDGRIVRPEGWYEVFPPFPTNLTEVTSDNTTPAYEIVV